MTWPNQVQTSGGLHTNFDSTSQFPRSSSRSVYRNAPQTAVSRYPAAEQVPCCCCCCCCCCCRRIPKFSARRSLRRHAEDTDSNFFQNPVNRYNSNLTRVHGHAWRSQPVDPWSPVLATFLSAPRPLPSILINLCYPLNPLLLAPSTGSYATPSVTRGRTWGRSRQEGREKEERSYLADLGLNIPSINPNFCSEIAPRLCFSQPPTSPFPVHTSLDSSPTIREPPYITCISSPLILQALRRTFPSKTNTPHNYAPAPAHVNIVIIVTKPSSWLLSVIINTLHNQRI